MLVRYDNDIAFHSALERKACELEQKPQLSLSVNMCVITYTIGSILEIALIYKIYKNTNINKGNSHRKELKWQIK